MKTQKQRLGAWGEQVAITFLIQKGYTIVQNNFYTRFGEIDIVAYREYPIHGRTLCFIEVKTRTNYFEAAARATNANKQKHMQRAAREFCIKQGIAIDNTPILFEHISIQPSKEHKARVFHYILPIE